MFRYTEVKQYYHYDHRTRKYTCHPRHVLQRSEQNSVLKVNLTGTRCRQDARQFNAANLGCCVKHNYRWGILLRHASPSLIRFQNSLKRKLYLPLSVSYMWIGLRTLGIVSTLFLLLMSVGWDHASELWPLDGLLFVPRMINESEEVEWCWQGKTRNSKENMSECHFVHTNSTRNRTDANTGCSWERPATNRWAMAQP
jgi:hypothetical protein